MRGYGRRTGRLTGIIGPMFSGKTTELCRRANRLTLAGKEWRAFKPWIDQRYSKEDIVTHDLTSLRSIVVKSSEEIIYHLERVRFNVAAAFLDETQFFDSGVIEVINHILNQGVDVVYAALSSTSEGKPFPFSDGKKHVGDLLALPHEDIIVLKAVCTRCGQDAVFTFYIGSEEKTGVIKVGGSESYTALCRDCYNEMLSKSVGKGTGTGRRR